MLDALDNITCVAHSRLYGSKPHGPQDQPDYVNAVAKLETTLDVEALLNALQTIEKAHHRVRKEGERWGARTLDLDILLYDNAIIETPRLSVPHPRLFERPFVLYPLLDIEPALVFPDGRTLVACVQQVSHTEIWPLDDVD